jgi:hypothetical protein
VTTPSRPLSGVERVWLVADRIAPPFVNQLVLEGGGPIDRDALAAAVERLGRWPVCSAKLTGRLGGTRWQGGGIPWRMRVVDGRGWDGHSGDGAPFLTDRLPVETGPLCEVLVVESDPCRIVVRTHHAYMDGRGTLELSAALFAAARGEEPTRLPLAGPMDATLAAALDVSSEGPIAPNCAAPLDRVSDVKGTVWSRVSSSVSPRGVLPRLAWALAEQGDPSRRCRVDIPVDLRRHAPELRSTANLTGLIRLSVDSHRDRDQPVARVAAELERRLARKEEAGFVLQLDRVRRIPLATLERIGRTKAPDGYGATANLSNVGRLDLAALSGAGFEARRGFFVPPGSPSLPLFIALTGGPEGVEICGTMPAAFGDATVLRDLLVRLVASLEEGA